MNLITHDVVMVWPLMKQVYNNDTNIEYHSVIQSLIAFRYDT